MATAPPIAASIPHPATAIDPAVLQALEIGRMPRPRTPLGPDRPKVLDIPTTGESMMTSIRALAPPVANVPMTSPRIAGAGPHRTPTIHTARPSSPNTEGPYDVNKPTCSLNLVCYRSGAKGCELQQVQCILRSKFPDDDSFDKVVHANKQLVYNNAKFFSEMRRLYKVKMCSPLRRYLSLKSLRAFRILAYTPTTRPIVVPFDDFVLQEMLYAYRHPQTLEDNDEWIRWVFRLRRKDKRHAVEFVEGWNTTRIAVAGTIPWLSSCIVGIAWAAAGGDVQSAFTVASFILTSSSVILALVAILSGIESSGKSVL
ncbi:hypothetical protein VMCG_05749 [Cytospora schulzeri]|uniref:Uncharacterized protein n=1 Tax=Cytospora schulzeri TaxID=448051 RepID=A0A423WIA1_9PEZI|nr:hypothetical protein VMCG_05749 [Valsa malicola]